MERFFSVLSVLTLGGSLMALLLLALKKLLGQRLSARVYYYLWLAVLLRFALPLPGLVETVGGEPVRVEPAYNELSPTRDFGRLRPSGGVYVPVETEVSAEAEAPAAPVKKEAVSSGGDRRLRPDRDGLLRLALFVYIAGALIRFILYCCSYHCFLRDVSGSLCPPHTVERRIYEAQNMAKKPELMRCSAVKTPMLLGLFRPLLLLPVRDYSPDMLRNIYRHELMHYRRKDMLYKWFSVLVFSLHWFNPLCLLVRRELNLACELSCDEMLISAMDREEKQSYGDTLISMAAGGVLPARVVATTFSTEKRNLKERLEQIMKFKKKKGSALAALLALLLLAGCGAAVGPGATDANSLPAVTDGNSPRATPGNSMQATPANSAIATPADSPALRPEDQALAETLTDFDPDKPIKVSNVDELLAAIGPDRQIWLEAGEYRLSEAGTYGLASNEYYSWEPCHDGYELVIHNVDNVSFVGMDEDKVSISAQPRYANVMRLRGCNNVMLAKLTLGHDEEPGLCAGGVVHLEDCQYVHVDKSVLYGCGIIGLYAQNCKKVFLSDSEIYDCSVNAVSSYSSYDVRVEDCEIYDCEAPYGGLFEVSSSTGFAVVNCDIYDNSATQLLALDHSQQVYFMGNDVNNCALNYVFRSRSYSPMLVDCQFDNVSYLSYCEEIDGFDLLLPVDGEGNEIDEKAMQAMEQRDVEYEGPKTAAPVDIERRYDAEGHATVTVKTVDEFLAAIGPDTTIELDAEIFDLSAAADYGAYGAQYYYWEEDFDGPGLVISGVEGLRIVGLEGRGAVISAVPRYANVISFINCKDIELSGFTAGHTEEPGSCSGGVLRFDSCAGVKIKNCGMYGCGIIGLWAEYCEGFIVEDSKIYECSNCAVWLGTCRNFSFVDCLIHDCGSPEFILNDVRDITFDDMPLKNGAYLMGENGPEEKIFES